MRADRSSSGFTLVELLLAAALGLLLCGVMGQLLLGELRQGGFLAQAMLMKGVQRRTLALVKADLRQAASWQVDPNPLQQWACGLSGRRPLLAIQPRNGSELVLYSIGSAPSAIWQSPVLMRCGPAFDLDGRPSAGAYQNRVVLDGVDHAGIADHPHLPLLLLELQQRRGDQSIRSEAVG
jgi:type II secretory pathway pseudopilin PulG